MQSVSADGTTNGIVWSEDVSGANTILEAYNANNLSTPLYTSSQAGPRDTAGGAEAFATPTIANGHVYVGAQFEVDVYGLLPTASGASTAARTPAATVLTRQRRVLAAATPAGPLATRIARVALPSSRRTPARAEGAGTKPS